MKKLLRKLRKSIVRISYLLCFFMSGVFISCTMLTPKGHDSDLKPFVDEFAKYIGDDISDLDRYTVKFESLYLDGNKETIGTCETPAGIISIDPSYFYSQYTQKIERTVIIFHELVHCHCDGDHDESILADGCPSNIMYPKIPTVKCLKKHWTKYMKDMKERCE